MSDSIEPKKSSKTPEANRARDLPTSVTTQPTVAAGAFTVEDMKTLIETMAASNTEAFKSFAQELTYKIAHPDPTPEEVERRKKEFQSRAEMARFMETKKKETRERCPHKRGPEGGLFQGQTVIAWCFPTMSFRDEDGRRHDSQPVAMGVCMWCGSEFKPGDPDYAEKVAMGLNQVASVVPINSRTGIFG